MSPQLIVFKPKTNISVRRGLIWVSPQGVEDLEEENLTYSRRQSLINSLLRMPELPRQRLHLENLLKATVQELLMPETHTMMPQAIIRDEQGRRTGEQADPRSSPRSDFFIYGSDAENILLLIQDALRGAFATAEELGNIAVDGRVFGEIASESFLAFAANLDGRHANPNHMVVILKDFTLSLYADFQRPGYPLGSGTERRLINTICWRSCYRECRNDEGILQEISNSIFVPSSFEADVEDIYDYNPDDTNVTIVEITGEENGENQRSNTPSFKMAESGNEVQPKVNPARAVVPRLPLTSSLKRDSKLLKSSDPVMVKHVTFRNEPTVETPVIKPTVVMEPRSTPKVATAPGQQLNWVTPKRDCVNVARQVAGMEKQNEGEGKEEEGCCAKVLSCLVETYAWIFD